MATENRHKIVVVFVVFWVSSLWISLSFSPCFSLFPPVSWHLGTPKQPTKWGYRHIYIYICLFFLIWSVKMIWAQDAILCTMSAGQVRDAQCPDSTQHVPQSLERRTTESEGWAPSLPLWLDSPTLGPESFGFFWLSKLFKFWRALSSLVDKAWFYWDTCYTLPLTFCRHNPQRTIPAVLVHFCFLLLFGCLRKVFRLVQGKDDRYRNQALKHEPFCQG